MTTAAGSSALATPAGTAGSEHDGHTGAQSARTNVILGLGLAAALTLITLVAGTGTALTANTWTQLGSILVGAALIVTLLVAGAHGRRWGLTTLVLFAAVTAFTAASIAWSVQPDNSWLEANRTLSYLAVFAGAIALARLFPERWPAVVGAVAVTAAVISLYALVIKVFPETFDKLGLYGRIYLPLGYWNAMGLVAALGAPACLWAGARPVQSRWLRALAVPAIAVLVTVVILSYSRSALLALVLGIGCWFACVPLRLRGALVLALGLLGAAVLAGWAESTKALTNDNVALASRSTAGHGFGVVLVIILAALTWAGLFATSRSDRTQLTPVVRRRIGTALIVLVALVPVLGVAGLAASSRGLTGEISHAWHSLTAQKYVLSDTKERIGSLESSRPRDWSEGITVARHALLAGVGAAGYGTARTRYTTNAFPVQHAHSYVIETFADFGLIGLALNLALLIAWAIAAARTVGVRPRDVPPERKAERAGLLTLACVVIVFGAHSAIDWTWFVPGTASVALVCAGWVAGRGPLTQPVGRHPHPRRLIQRPALGAATIAIVAITLLVAWVVIAPMRATQATNAAYGALERGDTRSAIADARSAAASDPLSIAPLGALAAAYNKVGEPQTARAELVKATQLQPQNPDTWLELGTYDLAQLRHPANALADFRKALALNLGSPDALAGIARASAQP
jgi:hypothetical protein